jgi:hypothetical protein
MGKTDCAVIVFGRKDHRNTKNWRVGHVLNTVFSCRERERKRDLN